MIRLHDRSAAQGLAVAIYCARIQPGKIPDASSVAAEAAALIAAVDNQLPVEDRQTVTGNRRLRSEKTDNDQRRRMPDLPPVKSR